jgi:cytochrome c
VYLAKCAACHGPTGTEGPSDRLVGEKLPVKTIGSFWPYATAVFDYIRPAQLFDKPGSLTNEEVYAVTAWLLFRNQIIPADQVIDAETLPKVRMPNRDGFVPDPRPEVE